MNHLQPETINLRTGAIALSRLRQYCQLSPAEQFPACPRRGAAGQAGLLEEQLCPFPVKGCGGLRENDRLEMMNHRNFSTPRCYLYVPLEVMEALARKSAEMGFNRAGYNSAAYLVSALSELTVEELAEVLRRKDLLPGKEPNC